VEFDRHLVPVPGALVLVLRVGDASGENTQLHNTQLHNTQLHNTQLHGLVP
jgi:hypothetical protein